MAGGGFRGFGVGPGTTYETGISQDQQTARALVPPRPSKTGNVPWIELKAHFKRTKR